ncbi:uncharacterized protein HMPREF1541_02659 [Cyphellophora europaea CBS 101466]|uniref:Calponin-homology (CH) domain-containing protein n=1 Tax=Cyphellophora europaea (strain CBS 101466) TaxID=1220924 RepID=W2S4I2_CYPE1|nr:uncharacterized protein HMPREF1541_02659 [Cyphellophora europaea CBS 101466]ETN43500.1 hypothetical protein HMPREF1541_02659 [Cyphellophora europaea CBS 101466]
MYQRLSATPCPVASSDLTINRRDSIFSNDTTTNLDFTTEFKASFRDVKPRRPPTKRKTAGLVGITIHEDEELNTSGKGGPEHTATKDLRPPQSKPLQHPRRRVSFAQAADSSADALCASAQPTGLSKAPRRHSIRPQTTSQAILCEDTLPVVPSPKIAKPARRGTIYIPSDDTTMPSMFLSIFSPLKNPPPNAAEHDAGKDMTGLAMQMAYKRRGPRKSTLATSPKRGPLHPSRDAQAPNVLHDRPGTGPGKENLPPGQHVRGIPKDHRPTSSKERVDPGKAVLPRLGQHHTSRLLEPMTSSLGRTQDKTVNAGKKTKPAWNSNFLLPKPRRTTQQHEQEEYRVETTSETRATFSKSSVPSRFVVPHVDTVVEHQYDFLPEGVADASMYEEDWLGQQEVAITQLINNLFDASPVSRGNYLDDLQRLRMTEVYGKPSMALLYKRLQGALLYGSLSIPYDTLEQGHQLYGDLGRRKSYTRFWLDTYDNQILKQGLEVVVGRIIPSRVSADGRDKESGSPAPKAQRPIQRFIEKFMIRNEDATPDCKSTKPAAWSYRRTVLRSLMLVKLLDMVKTEASLNTTANLFRSNSSFKSSSNALAAVMQQLNASAGDPTRTLKQLGYALSHVQYPLEEFNYRITSLAVDLRDGVRLTRLVELLLYRSASRSLGHAQDSEGTTTIVIPSGNTINLADGDQDWPLSQHLKMPCISRATRLYNVKLALSALKEVKGVGSILHDISAEDIVDGFREKTVRLLWGLSSKWGLGGLVDWDDVKSEIKRLGRTKGRIGNLCLEDLELEEDDEGYLRFKSLLKAWVKAVAISHGLRVRNFTSDFADGRLFEALVREYQPFFQGCAVVSKQKSLAERLGALGCSDEFARLFSNNHGSAAGQQIFDRDFVLASIAFLCSRLLRPSKTARAALVLQNAWRRHWDKVIVRRKLVLQTLARACAEQVRAAEAKACIWRTWCKFRSRRNRQARQRAKGMDQDDIWLSL